MWQEKVQLQVWTENSSEKEVLEQVHNTSEGTESTAGPYRHMCQSQFCIDFYAE